MQADRFDIEFNEVVGRMENFFVSFKVFVKSWVGFVWDLLGDCFVEVGGFQDRVKQGG